jgi:hypothetical protein
VTAAWRTFCRGDKRFAVDGDGIVVSFEDGRSHRVLVAETEATFELTTVVARAARLRDIEDLEIRIWRRNRPSRLHGFRVDRRGRLCAYGWVPRAGITAEEFRLIVHRVAVESDRLEFLLTGADVE